MPRSSIRPLGTPRWGEKSPSVPAAPPWLTRSARRKRHEGLPPARSCQELHDGRDRLCTLAGVLGSAMVSAKPPRAKLFHEEPEAGKLHIRIWCSEASSVIPRFESFASSFRGETVGRRPRVENRNPVILLGG